MVLGQQMSKTHISYNYTIWLVMLVVITPMKNINQPAYHLLLLGKKCLKPPISDAYDAHTIVMKNDEKWEHLETNRRRQVSGGQWWHRSSM